MSLWQGYAHMASVISQESCQDWDFMGLGGVFNVEWIRMERLPFHCTQQILNPWNDNKKVQISRDGQVRGWFINQQHELLGTFIGNLRLRNKANSGF